jgi:hypothetical protein
MASDLSFPDGLANGHAAERQRHRFANPASILVLGALLLAALTGLLGGSRPERTVATAPAAELALTAPRTLRSGVFFEMIVEATARRDMADAVIAIDAAAWHDLTINTQVPAAESEEAKDGRFRFHFGALKAGERLTMKVDGQVNPSLMFGTRGQVALLDGEVPLATLPLRLTVLP